MGKVAVVEDMLQKLENKLKDATEEKARVEAEAAACMDRLGLAERLVGGLSSENERWGNEIEKLKGSSVSLVGDCMLAAGFVSYVGAFDNDNRRALWSGNWLIDLGERKVPMTEGVDPIDVLITESDTAKMISKGLPADRISVENGAIVSACKRWPLIIDPQVQGIKWLRQKEEENGLAVIQLSQKNWLRAIESAITNGHCVIIENLGEEIDATLEPVLSRAIYKKGRALFLKLGGEEVEYDPGFTLYLQTKLSNPHYKPEIAAQCTLINFIATEAGLEDQLLAKVVGVERPDLEKQQQELQSAFVTYKIQLMELEDDLLERLANAPDDILSDVPLIEGLEATKAASKEINAALDKGKTTQVEINIARENYRKQASEGAMLYFLLTKLCAIDHMYQYSLGAFNFIFHKALGKAAADEAHSAWLDSQSQFRTATAEKESAKQAATYAAGMYTKFETAVSAGQAQYDTEKPKLDEEMAQLNEELPVLQEVLALVESLTGGAAAKGNAKAILKLAQSKVLALVPPAGDSKMDASKIGRAHV